VFLGVHPYHPNPVARWCKKWYTQSSSRERARERAPFPSHKSMERLVRTRSTVPDDGRCINQRSCIDRGRATGEPEPRRPGHQPPTSAIGRRASAATIGSVPERVAPPP
jgi:hypothetical protein